MSDEDRGGAATDRPPIWKRTPSLETLRERHVGTLVERIGIEFTGIGADWLRARMPVDPRTRQPAGILHGGASVALAETIGSAAASLCLEPTRYAVGLDINANHVRAVREGAVVGLATPLHVGRSTHVWQIEIREESPQRDAGALVCVARITMAILDR